MILAGGLGTRFRPVRDDIPKPLAPVAGRPVLEHQISALAAGGVRRIVLCVGYRHQQIEQHFGGGERFGVDLVYSRETQALGTAGALADARSCLYASPFIVLNGDTLMPDLDYLRLSAKYAESAAEIMMVVTQPPDAGAYGIVHLDTAAIQVLGFQEKCGLDADYAQAWISAGAYVFSHEIFKLIPAGRPCSMENEVFPKVLQQNLQIAVFAYRGFFGDMGTPAGYARTDQYLAKRARAST